MGNGKNICQNPTPVLACGQAPLLYDNRPPAYNDENFLSLPMYRPLLLGLGSLILLGATSLLALLFWPLSAPTQPLADRSLSSFAEATAALAELDGMELPLLREDCASIRLDSGKKEAKVALLLHGYTNCPKQFLEFGQRLQAKGYNVLIPRAPGHGYSDRGTDALGAVTAGDFATYLHTSVAIAEQMGEEITLMGLSGGGTLTLWATLFEPKVDRFIAVAPVAYPRGFAPILRRGVIRYAAWTPNEFSWWDKVQQQNLPGPMHAYRRYASKSMGAILHMAAYVEEQLGRLPQDAPITFVINDADKALRDEELHQLADRFAAAGASVERLVFPRDLGYPHDLMDPENIKDNKDAVYTALLELFP